MFGAKADPIALCRSRREKLVFSRLLSIVPNLAERLMECSNEEVMGIADLVSRFLPPIGPLANASPFMASQDSEGCLWCEVR